MKIYSTAFFEMAIVAFFNERAEHEMDKREDWTWESGAGGWSYTRRLGSWPTKTLLLNHKYITFNIELHIGIDNIAVGNLVRLDLTKNASSF